MPFSFPNLYFSPSTPCLPGSFVPPAPATHRHPVLHRPTIPRKAQQTGIAVDLRLLRKNGNIRDYLGVRGVQECQNTIRVGRGSEGEFILGFEIFDKYFIIICGFFYLWFLFLIGNLIMENY
jgi:hypothetical protein